MEMPYEDQNQPGNEYKEKAEFVGIFFEFRVSIGVTEQADSTAPETNLVLRFGNGRFVPWFFRKCSRNEEREREDGMKDGDKGRCDHLQQNVLKKEEKRSSFQKRRKKIMFPKKKKKDVITQ